MKKKGIIKIQYMFTGIIEEVVKLKSSTTQRDIVEFVLEKPKSWKLHFGQSIAINGVCLTVTKFDDATFTVELMPETMMRSSYGKQIPEKVNLERAMSPDGLFEGHIVQGHVDELSQIIGVEETDQWRTIRIAYPKEKANLLVEKGSITIDGISLTVVEVQDEWFSVSLIPHTIANTTLGSKQTGDFVNLEYDILGKYIAKNLKLKKGENTRT